jgi:lipid A 3-O-deacylase
MKTLAMLVLAASAALPGAASADWRPATWFVQAGAGTYDNTSLTVGVAWPWSWRSSLWGAEVSGQTEASISAWRADAFGGGSQGFTQLSLVPMLRLRPGMGSSAWFFEAGIGISLLDKEYRTPQRRMSTAWNFQDTLGVGMSFGPRREQEIGLRYTHFSNASIQRPNPGLDFIQLRYASRF